MKHLHRQQLEQQRVVFLARALSEEIFQPRPLAFLPGLFEAVADLIHTAALGGRHARALVLGGIVHDRPSFSQMLLISCSLRLTERGAQASFPAISSTEKPSNFHRATLVSSLSPR